LSSPTTAGYTTTTTTPSKEADDNLLSRPSQEEDKNDYVSSKSMFFLEQPISEAEGEGEDSDDELLSQVLDSILKVHLTHSEPDNA